MGENVDGSKAVEAVSDKMGAGAKNLGTLL
jgi:hypothetical protein